MFQIELSSKANKALKKLLPDTAKDSFEVLFEDLTIRGVCQPDWPNYGKLKGVKGNKYHCHLSKGKPTYVVCWEEREDGSILIYYLGTHEKAPY